MFTVSGIDMETWCSDWFGGSYLIFEGMSGEWFLFSFVGILVLCHKTHGEAQISSCGSQKSDSAIPGGCGPFRGLVTWPLLLSVVQKLGTKQTVPSLCKALQRPFTLKVTAKYPPAN